MVFCPVKLFLAVTSEINTCGFCFIFVYLCFIKQDSLPKRKLAKLLQYTVMIERHFSSFYPNFLFVMTVL